MAQAPVTISTINIAYSGTNLRVTGNTGVVFYEGPAQAVNFPSPFPVSPYVLANTLTVTYIGTNPLRQLRAFLLTNPSLTAGRYKGVTIDINEASTNLMIPLVDVNQYNYLRIDGSASPPAASFSITIPRSQPFPNPTPSNTVNAITVTAEKQQCDNLFFVRVRGTFSDGSTQDLVSGSCYPFARTVTVNTFSGLPGSVLSINGTNVIIPSGRSGVLTNMDTVRTLAITINAGTGIPAAYNAVIFGNTMVQNIPPLQEKYPCDRCGKRKPGPWLV